MAPHDTAQDVSPMGMRWVDVTLDVRVKDPSAKRTESKRILGGITGVAYPGQLLALMGPSGAGKSVLLDCLANRQRDYEGTIAVNGLDWSKATLKRMSYIVQRDLFYETITVQEHLTFQGRLRLGATLSSKQIADRVNAVMADLGLVKCRNALIGGASLRGISGGERKRLSLATEMLTNPTVLFVDEPTSGLDSHMAVAIVQLLHQLARQGRTVVATIHQPSPEIFALFDRLHLVADGATVYDGTAADVAAYFSSIGYDCPEFTSPSDYLMRQLVVDADADGTTRVDLLKQEWTKRRQSASPRTLVEENLQRLGESMQVGLAEDARLGFMGQTAVLMQRNLTRILRDRIAFRAALLQTLFIAFLVGSVYFQLDVDQAGIQNIVGVLFFISINQALISSKPVFASVPMELPLLSREYKAGLFHLTAWYLAKNVSELALQILLPIAYFLPQYLLIGIGHGAGVYFAMQLLVVLLSSAAVGFGYMISCICGRADIAPIIGVALLLPFILFGGLFLNAEDAPGYLIWLQYISPIKYCFEGLMKVFWLEIREIACAPDTEACVANAGRGVLELSGVSGRSATADGLILLALNAGFRFVGLIALLVNLKWRPR